MPGTHRFKACRTVRSTFAITALRSECSLGFGGLMICRRHINVITAIFGFFILFIVMVVLLIIMTIVVVNSTVSIPALTFRLSFLNPHQQ
jgi:hypothetical protein